MEMVNMNSPWFRAFLLSLPLLIASAPRNPASGNPFREAVYASPLETVLLEPTSYVYPTSYLLPTTSYVPSSYVPTSYFLPAEYTLASSAYVVPTYYRRRLFGPRRYVETIGSYYVPTATYYPTTVVYPTTTYTPTVLVDQAVVATSAPACCESRPAPAPACCEPGTVVRPPLPAPSASPAPKSTETRTTEQPPSEVSSIPANVPSYRPEPGATGAGTGPGSGAGAGTGGGGRATPVPATPPESGTPPIPTAPAPAEQPGTSIPRSPEPPAPAPMPTPAPATVPPVAPGGESETTHREANRPVLPFVNRRNILEGKVVSSETRSAEEGVHVIISSRTGAFEDRAATTDASGHYAVHVPDGDWAVKVQMPSGRVYEVSRLTISDGLITDSLGRNVPTLTITR
jgi:hypothetical protein